MEEDDPIVQEIPVYLSEALAHNLYVYQYPVRPASKDWKDSKVINACVKPKNKLVRMEIGLDAYSDKYCASKGEQIAINTDGLQGFIKDKELDKNRYFKADVMDKIVYESNVPCVDTHHYAVGLLQDKELHITPIQGIIQLRPSCSYYDKTDKKSQEKKELDGSEEEEKELEPTQVKVKFARKETEVAKKAREKSYQSISQKISEEPWYDALWKSSSSDQAELERLKLYSGTTVDGSALTLGVHEYMTDLVPPTPEDIEVLPEKNLILQDRIKELLISANLMSFAEILEALGGAPNVADSSVVSALNSSSCCVRGLWTPRSDNLYTRAAPVPPALMCAARDHVLYLFTQHAYVDRRKITASVRLPPDVVLEILKPIAKLNPNTGWELLIPPDVSFEAKYPEIVHRQNLYWEGRQRQFNEALMEEFVPKRQRKKSQRDSFSSDTMMSPKQRCNSFSEEESDRKRLKNKCGAGGGKRTRNVSGSNHDATVAM
ncbi:DNA-directed RNA polymerase III subunit RPC5 [Leptidea sinapis]|uniref:DNA-directed RNA polymerase III subunit RPC5 n=1 Tax=Leptidea sinapis TaxID=189913 RepID=UPI0021C41510|nr:DNA-directed RNA polymerase III subunit RPC5 [Leptidea sinapis]